MDISSASLDLGPMDFLVSSGTYRTLEGAPQALRPAGPPGPEALRHAAWEIGERRLADCYGPPASHVGLAMVHPTGGFAYWRLLHGWVEATARARGGRWDGSRPILRLYDVSYINFTGLNANRIQDHTLPGLTGQLFFGLPTPGTWQIAEVGFLLRSGEFIPAARSPAVAFAPEAPCRHTSPAALLVTAPGRVEQVNSVWDAEHELRERRRPRLRHPLRIAAFAFASRPSGQQGALADFVTELATGQRVHGHEVHVFVPATESFAADRESEGVVYHPLAGVKGAGPIELARSFAARAEARLAELPPFDLIHLHEWMTGVCGWAGHRPTVLSLCSIEATRRAGRPEPGAGPDEQSRQIEQIEKKVARAAGAVLTPTWLRDRAVAELGLDSGRVHPFPMEGRLPNEWEAPLDFGKVKMGYGMGPLDRVVLFIGPLEHAAGVDILLEALPVLLRRWGNLRLAYVGNGPMRGPLEWRAHELGVGWAVRFLGDQGGMALTNLLRSSEALVLPSRYRIAMDDAVVDLARKAGRPVVTTHGGPSHMVRHEEDGLLTYDNPGSMVWAVDRVLGDPGHAERMGQNGRRSEGGTMRWSEVARAYLEACVGWFPELTVTRM
jgi:glycosyltransferase involved in cell wall biosynthesis